MVVYLQAEIIPDFEHSVITVIIIIIVFFNFYCKE